MSDYPEHERRAVIQEELQAIGDFLEAGPYMLCELVDSGKAVGGEPVMEYQPVPSIQRVLAQYFGLDLDLLERELRQMLEALQS